MKNYEMQNVSIEASFDRTWVVRAVRSDGRHFGILYTPQFSRWNYQVYAKAGDMLVQVSKGYTRKGNAVKVLKNFLNDLSLFTTDEDTINWHNWNPDKWTND